MAGVRCRASAIICWIEIGCVDYCCQDMYRRQSCCSSCEDRVGVLTPGHRGIMLALAGTKKRVVHSVQGSGSATIPWMRWRRRMSSAHFLSSKRVRVSIPSYALSLLQATSYIQLLNASPNIARLQKAQVDPSAHAAPATAHHTYHTTHCTLFTSSIPSRCSLSKPPSFIDRV